MGASIVDANGELREGICKTYGKLTLKRGMAPEEAVNPEHKNKSARLLTFNGETMPIARWAKLIGISGTCLIQRIDRLGWPLEKALTQRPRSA